MASVDADVVIIGSGIAGLMAAHLLADEVNVILITKARLTASNSNLAQGGIAAAIGDHDDWRLHLADTMLAGYGHNRYEQVKTVVRRAPTIIETMQKLGVPFDAKHGSLTLGREAAHRQRRIIHAYGDQTGRAFIETLVQLIIQRVNIYEDTMAVELLVEDGAVGGVKTNKGAITARHTIMATGGAGQLFECTSNAPEATGDGMALAYRAGALLADLEFIQFHPTVLSKDGASFGLVSEAVRGEGAQLVTAEGERIMGTNPLKELAPRDIVSRALYAEIQAGKSVYLDCRMIENFSSRFPGISRLCQQAKVTDSLLPVVPGAHFISGGIHTDGVGRTSLQQLYAIGEVACTGVHGANRLASNSLLEGLVFAELAVQDILSRPRTTERITRDHSKYAGQLALPARQELQQRMTACVGIERSAESLMEMKEWLSRFGQRRFTCNNPAAMRNLNWRICCF